MVHIDKKKILNVAIKHLALNGLHGMKTDEVARESQISKGSLFRLFPNKVTLANCCLEEVILLYKEFLPEETFIKKSYREQYEHVSNVFFEIYRKYPYHFMYFEFQLHHEFITEDMIKKRNSLRKYLENWFDFMIEKDVFSGHTRMSVHAIFVGSLTRMFREELDGNIKITKNKFKKFQNLVWDSLSNKKNKGKCYT